jgi:hypothetical protein
MELRVNNQTFYLPTEICERSGTFKNLREDVPSEEKVTVNWNSNLDVDFNTVMDLISNGGSTDSLLIYVETLMLATYLDLDNLHVKLELKEEPKSWFNWIGSFIGRKHYLLLKEFQALKEADILLPLVPVLQKLDMRKYGPSFLKVYYPDVSEDDAFRDLGFKDAVDFHKTNCYREVYFKDRGYFNKANWGSWSERDVVIRNIRIDVLTHGTKEWIVLDEYRVLYLDSHGQLKCINEKILYFQGKRKFTKLFYWNPNYVVVESETQYVMAISVRTGNTLPLTETPPNMSLRFVEDIGDSEKLGVSLYFADQDGIVNVKWSTANKYSFENLQTPIPNNIVEESMFPSTFDKHLFPETVENETPISVSPLYRFVKELHIVTRIMSNRFTNVVVTY